MRRGRLVVVAVLAVLLGVCGLVGLNMYRGSPVYALSRLRTAIVQKDRVTFEHYVDVESVVDGAVDDVFSFILADAMTEVEGKGLEALGAAFGAAMMNQMKPAIKSAGEQAILTAVETGSFAGAKPEVEGLGDSEEIDMAALAEDAGLAEKTFAGIGDVQRDGDVATVPLRFRPLLLDTTLALGLRMERRSDLWMIVEITGIESFLRTVTDLQERRLAAVNDSILPLLQNELEVSPIDIRVVHRGWFSRDLVLSGDVRNIGEDTISGVAVQLMDGETPIALTDVALTRIATIAPGETMRLTQRIEYNEFIDWHRRLLNGDVTGRPVLVEFVGGRPPIELYMNWDEYLTAVKE